MKSLLKIVRVELKSNFTLGKLIGIIAVALIPLIGPLVSHDVHHGNSTLTEASGRVVMSVLSQAVMYSLLLRIVLLLKDSSTLDKNRALFLRMDKNKVVFGKVFADAMLFLASIMLAAIIGPLLVVYKNHGELSGDIISKMVLYVSALFALYLLISVGSRYIVSKIKSKIKWFVFALFMVVTIIVYIVMSVVVREISDVKDLFTNQKLILSFIPFVNITYIGMAFDGSVPYWTIAPFMVEVLLFIIIIWKSLSTNVKEFLCG